MVDTEAMSDTDHAPTSRADDDHSTVHGTASEPLGEPDLQAWAAALLGGGVGLLVALALFVATQA